MGILRVHIYICSGRACGARGFTTQICHRVATVATVAIVFICAGAYGVVIVSYLP